MTDEELKALVAENSRAIREMRVESDKRRAESDKQRAESDKQRTESDKQRTESDKRWAESEERWQESQGRWQESQRRWQEGREESERLWQQVVALRQESERKWQEGREESQRLREESERRWQEGREEILASRREMDRLVTGFERRLGQLGNALGDYTESLLEPSLERVLRERFGMTDVIAPEHMELDGEDYEIDMVGHAKDKIAEVYIVEIKSRLREEGIQQLLDHLRRFPRAFPEHRGKNLFGILAAVKIPKNVRARALKAGLYLATIKDDVFELSTPDDFVPQAFGLRGLNP